MTGWQKPEYEQMGIWPGDDYFSRRYDYLTEYVQVLRDLWGSGKSDFKGDFSLWMIVASVRNRVSP